LVLFLFAFFSLLNSAFASLGLSPLVLTRLALFYFDVQPVYFLLLLCSFPSQIFYQATVSLPVLFTFTLASTVVLYFIFISTSLFYLYMLVSLHYDYPSPHT